MMIVRLGALLEDLQADRALPAITSGGRTGGSAPPRLVRERVRGIERIVDAAPAYSIEAPYPWWRDLGQRAPSA